MEHINEPIQLISISSDGELHVFYDAKYKLASLMKEKVSVVTCVGQYRQGKSYLMSQLYGKNKSFKTGSTTQRETKGVWMMTKQHHIRNDLTMVYLDTEGLFDTKHSDTNFDAKLFALAWLCSSAVIINVKTVLDSSILNVLNKALIFAEKWSAMDDNKSVITRPDIHFVIRDSQMDMVDDNGKPVSNEEYLENLLKGSNVLSNMLIEKKYLHTLCSPAEKNILKKLDEASEHELDPEFITQLSDLKSTIFNDAKPFQVNSMSYTMKDWLKHVNILVKDQDKTPNFLASSRDVAIQLAMDDFAKATKELKELVPMSPEEFTSRLNKCVETILNSCKAFEDSVVKGKITDESMNLQKMNEDKFAEADSRKRDEEKIRKLEQELLKRKEEAQRKCQEEVAKKNKELEDERKRNQEELDRKEAENKRLQEETANKEKELEAEKKRNQEELDKKEAENKRLQDEAENKEKELEAEKDEKRKEEKKTKEMQARIEKAKERSNNLDAAGIGAVGTAAIAGIAIGTGMLLAPFTLGSSVILGSAVGAAAVGAGLGGGVGFGISRMMHSSKKNKTEDASEEVNELQSNV